MVANILAARALIALIVAATVGTWGVMAHPVNTDNPFMGLIALQNPPVFHALAYGYATLWFSTTFFVASLVGAAATVTILVLELTRGGDESEPRTALRVGPTAIAIAGTF